MPDPSDEDVLDVLRSAAPEAVARLRRAVEDYRAATGSLVEWRGGRDPAGTVAVDAAYPVYDDRVWEVLGALQGVGAFVVFDWMHWKRAAVVRDARFVASASAPDLARLVTVLLRGERFGDGVIAGAVESGVLPVLAERILGVAGGGPEVGG
jgi:hypothetical protein